MTRSGEKRGSPWRHIAPMGMCMSCCTSVVDETSDPLLSSDRIDSMSAEARRKAADAALRRAGSMAKALRPKQKKQEGQRCNATSSSAYGDGMRWTAG